MFSSKNTKRSLLMSVLALVLCISMLIGSTFAWFTDSVTSAGNKIQAGTLNVDLVDEGGNSLNGEILKFVDQDQNDLWEPGCTYNLQAVKVVNKGSLALKYEMVINGIIGDAKLLEAIEWTVTVNGVETKLADLKGYLLAGETSDAIVLSGHMKEEAGNEYQGLSVDGISISVFATQYTYEKDSFNELYDDIAIVSDEAALREAVAAGKNVMLTADVDLGNVPVVVNADIFVDLNGKTLSGKSTSSTSSYLIKVNSGKKLVLKDGEVSFYATTPDTNWGGEGQPAFPGYANNAISCSGTLVVDGATIKNNTAPGGASYAVDCYPGANLIVEDGVIDGCGKVAIRTFANSMTTPINVTINGGTITGRRAVWIQLPGSNSAEAPTVNLTVNGGTLISTDPAGDNLAVYSYSYGQSFANTTVAFNGGEYYGELVFGGGYKGDKETVTVNAANCKLNNDAYRYVEGNGTELIQAANSNKAVATNADQLVEALENGEDVVLVDNVKIEPASMSNAYGKTGINVKKGQTIDGNGNTLDIKGAGGTWDSGINTTGGLIKNIKVTGSFRGIFINHNSTYSDKVVLENVIIEGTTYTISCDQGTGKGFEATNSTFNGWTSYAATLGDAKFVDCSFGEGNGYAYCRPYAPTAFVGCDFEADFQVDPRAAVTFENCTVGGVALTAENLSTLVTSNIQNASVIG